MRIARVFFNVDMRMSFQGLTQVLKDAKIDAGKLSKGDLLVFLNHSLTAFKVLAGNSYLVYFNNQKRRVPLEALQYLPEFFGGSEMSFQKAVEKSIRSKLQPSVRIVKAG
jgi:hypothetical protein